MKTITVKKYVAFDGSTFTNEKDCIEYENNAVALTNILDACRVIKSLEHYSPKFFNDEDNIPTYSDLTTPFTTLDKKYSWIFIADNKEFDKVKHALMHDLPNSYLVKHIQPPSAYPDILVVEQSKSNSRSSIKSYKFTGRYRYLYDEMQEFKEYKQYISSELDKLLANT